MGISEKWEPARMRLSNISKPVAHIKMSGMTISNSYRD